MSLEVVDADGILSLARKSSIQYQQYVLIRCASGIKIAVLGFVQNAY